MWKTACLICLSVYLSLWRSWLKHENSAYVYFRKNCSLIVMLVHSLKMLFQTHPCYLLYPQGCDFYLRSRLYCQVFWNCHLVQSKLETFQSFYNHCYVCERNKDKNQGKASTLSIICAYPDWHRSSVQSRGPHVAYFLMDCFCLQWSDVRFRECACLCVCFCVFLSVCACSFSAFSLRHYHGNQCFSMASVGEEGFFDG